jgi:hypothetical protein
MEFLSRNNMDAFSLDLPAISALEEHGNTYEPYEYANMHSADANEP